MGSLLVVLVGGLMLCAPLALVGSRLYSAWPSSVDYRAWEDQGSRERLVELAMDSLIAIRFQQTISSDWSGTISLGGGNSARGRHRRWLGRAAHHGFAASAPVTRKAGQRIPRRYPGAPSRRYP